MGVTQVGGFGNCRRLGPWLGSLYQTRPDLRPAILQLSEEHAHLQEWTSLLSKVCNAHGLEPPTQGEAWPICGGDCVVFKVGNNVVKFFVDEVRPMCITIAEMEGDVAGGDARVVGETHA